MSGGEVGGGRRGRRPPPWWPRDEAWPPTGATRWRRTGRRLLWRVAGYGLALFLLLAAVVTAGILLVATASGIITAPPVYRVMALAALLLVALAVLRGGRRFRRLAIDVSSVIDAASRIEAGEYGVQIAERGPRELRTLARSFNAMSARLAAQDRQRRAFVADLTHELRTPLAIIRGQAEAIGDGLYPGDPAHVAPILDATHSLETLVEALGTMTLADAGSLMLHREPVEVGVLVASTISAFATAADAAGVHLQADVAADVPALDADPARIRAVLGNLLSNAIRYTPAAGTVTVSARRTGDRVMIAVRDTGPGIPEELRAHIFDRFVKDSGSPGSGLGLAIAKDIVTAHGGTIEAISPAGEGTEVRVTLPIASA
ncbi:MAG TPA: HAMP domain-containing sensor histidine kinase [Candidatus Limnocylindrales bacterium]|nr:HAMP domain-containing sensor histidine kinase [Candidatus Limnocylindrales bacterium]